MLAHARPHNDVSICLVILTIIINDPHTSHSDQIKALCDLEYNYNNYIIM